MPYRPNEAMMRAAQTALDYNDSVTPSNRWGTPVGIRRARKIADGGLFDKDEITAMFSFLSRFKDTYEQQRASKRYGKGYYAYLGWGGPSALPWAEDKLARYERAGE